MNSKQLTAKILGKFQTLRTITFLRVPALDPDLSYGQMEA